MLKATTILSADSSRQSITNHTSSFAEPRRKILLGIKHPFSPGVDDWGPAMRYWDDTGGTTNRRRFGSEKDR